MTIASVRRLTLALALTAAPAALGQTVQGTIETGSLDPDAVALLSHEGPARELVADRWIPESVEIVEVLRRFPGLTAKVEVAQVGESLVPIRLRVPARVTAVPLVTARDPRGGLLLRGKRGGYVPFGPAAGALKEGQDVKVSGWLFSTRIFVEEAADPRPARRLKLRATLGKNWLLADDNRMFDLHDRRVGARRPVLPPEAAYWGSRTVHVEGLALPPRVGRPAPFFVEKLTSPVRAERTGSLRLNEYGELMLHDEKQRYFLFEAPRRMVARLTKAVREGTLDEVTLRGWVFETPKLGPTPFFVNGVRAAGKQAEAHEGLIQRLQNPDRASIR